MIGLRLEGSSAAESVKQTALHIGCEMKFRSRVIGGDRHRHRGADSASTATLQLDESRLVVAGHSPVDDVTEALHLDQRRDTRALVDGRRHRTAPAAEYRHSSNRCR